MGTSVILFGWNRSIPGREKISMSHFEEFSAYLAAQRKEGQIDAFDAVILDPHGGDLNGFFLIRGDRSKLDAMTSTVEWHMHVARAGLHLEGAGAISGVTGEAIAERMEIWNGVIPS